MAAAATTRSEAVPGFSANLDAVERGRRRMPAAEMRLLLDASLRTRGGGGA
jgi:hypothetical protein